MALRNTIWQTVYVFSIIFLFPGKNPTTRNKASTGLDVGRWKEKAAIEKGLRVPLVCMSFAGNPSEITSRSDYMDFAQYAEENNIQFLTEDLKI